jgi:hypothetical protein
MPNPTKRLPLTPSPPQILLGPEPTFRSAHSYQARFVEICVERGFVGLGTLDLYLLNPKNTREEWKSERYGSKQLLITRNLVRSPLTPSPPPNPLRSRTQHPRVPIPTRHLFVDLCGKGICRARSGNLSAEIINIHKAIWFWLWKGVLRKGILKS